MRRILRIFADVQPPVALYACVEPAVDVLPILRYSELQIYSFMIMY